jgi:hypothetical protein
MEIKLNVAEQPKPLPQARGKVVIAQNLIRTRELLDQDGNTIDSFKTKNIIKKASQ